MKKIPILLPIILYAAFHSVLAQNDLLSSMEIIKRFNDSLPSGWIAKQDSLLPDQIIIQSEVMELAGNMFSNDPLEMKGCCEIKILTVPFVLIDSITFVRARVTDLISKLPPQLSKDHLKEWHKQNAESLKIIDALPTHYKGSNSYRIRCDRIPVIEMDFAEYNNIMSFINRYFKKYPE